MKRRDFIKRGALFVPAIWIPKAIAFPPSRAPLQVRAAAAAGGGGCTTARNSVTGTTTGDGKTGNNAYIAQKFTAGATTTICKITLRLWEEGTAAGNLTAGIWSHDGGANEPDTAIDTSDAVSATLLAAAEADFDFSNGLSAAVTNATAYWIVLHDSAGGGFSGNGARWAYQTDGTDRSMISTDGSTWVEFSPDDPLKYALFSA